MNILTLSTSLVLILHYIVLLQKVLNINLKKNLVKPLIEKSIKIQLVESKPLKNKVILQSISKLSLKDLSVINNGRNFEKYYQNKIGTFGDNNRTTVNHGDDTIYKIFRKIDEMLIFPKDLYKHNMSGIVLTRIVFNSKGEFREELSILKGSNNFFKVYVARILRRALKKRIRNELET